jgi:hypothetical protein
VSVSDQSMTRQFGNLVGQEAAGAESMIKVW